MNNIKRILSSLNRLIITHKIIHKFYKNLIQVLFNAINQMLHQSCDRLFFLTCKYYIILCRILYQINYSEGVSSSRIVGKKEYMLIISSRTFASIIISPLFVMLTTCFFFLFSFFFLLSWRSIGKRLSTFVKQE